MSRLRCILAFHVALLLVVTVSCQTTDNNYDDNDDNNNGEEVEYVDNRIDETPTFVSPVEKFAKAVIAPLDWASNAAKSGIVGNIISDIAKPIENIVRPVGKAARRGFGDVLNMIGDRFKAIYPGTEWCGAGDIAKSSDEVGLFKNTDSCCRAHDKCKDSINAGESAHGLRNDGLYTRSHCLCDAKFYYCLKETNSIVATNIGVTYFNILRPQCFKKEYPAHCIRYGRTRLMRNKCLDYGYDKSKNKTWQWFDSPDYL